MVTDGLLTLYSDPCRMICTTMVWMQVIKTGSTGEMVSGRRARRGNAWHRVVVAVTTLGINTNDVHVKYCIHTSIDTSMLNN